MIGFDDERVRDEWARDAVSRPVWVDVRWPEGGESWWVKVYEAIEAFLKAVAEVVQPLVEALVEAIGPLVERVTEFWAALNDAEERQRPPVRHHNCRCVLPVERIDPVRAGRNRWWTRK